MKRPASSIPSILNLPVMNTLQGLPLLGYYKQLIETKEDEQAWNIFHEFFETFDDEGPEELLWFMLTAAMKLDSEEINGRHRGNMIFFYEYTVALFKAAQVLYEQHRGQLPAQEE
jgi:hypothetical protein